LEKVLTDADDYIASVISATGISMNCELVWSICHIAQSVKKDHKIEFPFVIVILAQNVSCQRCFSIFPYYIINAITIIVAL